MNGRNNGRPLTKAVQWWYAFPCSVYLLDSAFIIPKPTERSPSGAYRQPSERQGHDE